MDNDFSNYLIDVINKSSLLLPSNSEPKKTTGPSGVIPIAVLKKESNVKILLLVFSFYC